MLRGWAKGRIRSLLLQNCKNPKEECHLPEMSTVWWEGSVFSVGQSLFQIHSSVTSDCACTWMQIRRWELSAYECVAPEWSTNSCALELKWPPPFPWDPSRKFLCVCVPLFLSLLVSQVKFRNLNCLELASGILQLRGGKLRNPVTFRSCHKLVLLLIEHHFSFMVTKLSDFGSLDVNIPWLCVTTP